MERYDIAIIGTGPAGLEAAITAKIRNKKIILFGNKNLSLKVEKAHTIQNYLGLPDIGGEELKAAYEAHLKAMDIEITEDKINAVYAMGEYFALQGNGTNYEAQTVILATGVSTAKAYPGEEQFLGRGVSYCATCDGAFFRNKTATVVGGGDTALEDALFLSAICKTVYVVHRRDTFRGAKHLYNRAKNKENIRFVLNSTVSEIVGENTVTGVKVKNVKNETETLIDTNAVFIAIGSTPDSGVFKGFVKLDKYGYVITDKNLQSSVSGVFAAGDVRQKTLRQIITAAADGAESVYNVQKFIFEH